MIQHLPIKLSPRSRFVSFSGPLSDSVGTLANLLPLRFRSWKMRKKTMK